MPDHHSFQFDTLDVSLQDEFDKFLQERGINQTLAYFVPEYAEYKEQKVSPSSFRILPKMILTPDTGVRQLAQERQGLR